MFQGPRARWEPENIQSPSDVCTRGSCVPSAVLGSRLSEAPGAAAAPAAPEHRFLCSISNGTALVTVLTQAPTF